MRWWLDRSQTAPQAAEQRHCNMATLQHSELAPLPQTHSPIAATKPPSNRYHKPTRCAGHPHSKHPSECARGCSTGQIIRKHSRQGFAKEQSPPRLGLHVAAAPARFTFLTVSALPWRSARSTQTARERRSAAGRRTENHQKIQKITSKVPPARIVACLPTEDQWVPDRRSSGYVRAFTATTGNLCVNGTPTQCWVFQGVPSGRLMLLPRTFWHFRRRTNTHQWSPTLSLGGSAPGCITEICTLQVGPLVLAPPNAWPAVRNSSLWKITWGACALGAPMQTCC